MRPHSKPVSPENASFIHEMDGIIAGLRARSPAIAEQCQSKINSIYEVLFKTGKLPQIVDRNIDYFYLDFLPQVITLLMGMISPGSIAILSINIVQFVVYKMNRGDPTQVRLLNIFFENKDLIECFRQLSSTESNQYNRIIAGGSVNYHTSPQTCQFVINQKNRGVDFISITIQNCGRRLMFHSLMEAIRISKGFEAFKDIAVLFEHCVEILHPSFRQFLFNFFDKKLFKKNKNDGRFNSPLSLYIHRIVFLLAIDSKMRREFSDQYFCSITKFFLNGYKDLPLNEIKVIMQIKKPEAKIIAFISSFLDVLFHQYYSDLNPLINDIVSYLRSNGGLEKETVCGSLIGKWSLMEKLLDIFEDDLDYDLIYTNLEGQNFSPSMVNILLFSIPKLKGRIDTPSEILRAIEFADESSLPFLAKLTVLDSDTLINVINTLLEKGDVDKKVTISIICKLVKENRLEIDFDKLSATIVSLLSGKELLSFFLEYNTLKVPDLPFFVQKVGKIDGLLSYLRKNFITQIYLIEKELLSFVPSDLLIKIFMDSFKIINNLRYYIIDQNSQIIHFSLILNAFYLSSYKFSDSFSEAHILIQQIINLHPQIAVDFILNEINSSDDFEKKILLFQCFDFSNVSAELIKIDKFDQKILMAFYLIRKDLKDLTNIPCDDANILEIYNILRKSEKIIDINNLPEFKTDNKLVESVIYTILIEADKGNKMYDKQKMFDLAIEAKFLPLLSAIDIKCNDVKIDSRKLSNLPLFFNKTLYNILVKSDDVTHLAAALKFSDSINLPQLLNMIRNKKSESEINRICSQIISEVQKIDDPQILDGALKNMPESINKYLLLSFFFSPTVCPVTRTPIVVRTFFSLFKESISPLMKFYETNKSASVSFDRCGLEDKSSNCHASAILQVFSSFLPLYEIYHSEMDVFMNLLKLLQFSSMPYIESSALVGDYFSEDHDAYDCWVHILSHILNSEQRSLFEFEVDQTVHNNLSLPPGTTKISNSLAKTKFDSVPAFLCLRLEKPNDLMILEPTLTINDQIFDLHAAVNKKKEIGKYSATVKNSVGMFIRCRSILCKVARYVELRNCYLLFYQCRGYLGTSFSRVWRRFSEFERKIIAPINISATRALNYSQIDWSAFPTTSEFLLFAILLLRKYKVCTPLNCMLKRKDFPEFVYSIIFEEKNFQFFYEAPDEFIKVMHQYPDQQKLRNALVKISQESDFFYCALSTLFALQMQPEDAFQCLCQLDDKTLNLGSSVPLFTFFFFYALRSKPERQKVLALLRNEGVRSVILPVNDESLIPFLIPINDEIFRAVIAHSSKEYVTELIRQTKEMNSISKEIDQEK